VKLLLELAWQRPEQGFGMLFPRLRRLSHGWNHKRVYRIYCSLKLNGKAKDVCQQDVLHRWWCLKQ